MLYNNAGGSTVRDSRVTDAPFEEFWSKMKLDLFGTWLGCRYGIQAMMDAGHGGSVINSTSIFALIGTHGKDAYTAAKGAVSALTRSMAVEYARHRIRVNAVAPGATATERVLKLLKDDASRANPWKASCSAWCSPRTSPTRRCTWPATSPGPPPVTFLPSTAA